MFNLKEEVRKLRELRRKTYKYNINGKEMTEEEFFKYLDTEIIKNNENHIPYID